MNDLEKGRRVGHKEDEVGTPENEASIVKSVGKKARVDAIRRHGLFDLASPLPTLVRVYPTAKNGQRR